MAKFETVPLAELKTRIPAKLLPMVEDFKEHLAKLKSDQGSRLVLEKGDDPKDVRRALKAAVTAMERSAFAFPSAGKIEAVSFYLEGRRGGRGRWRRGEAATAEGETPKRRRGRPRKSSSQKRTTT